MEDIAALLSSTYRIFNIPLNLYGFSFSFWEVFLFGAVACIIGRIIMEVFLDD